MPPPHRRIKCVLRGADFRQSGAHHIPLTILQPAFDPIHGEPGSLVRHPPHYNEPPISATLRPVLDALAHFEDHASLQCESSRQNYRTSTLKRSIRYTTVSCLRTSLATRASAEQATKRGRVAGGV